MADGFSAEFLADYEVLGTIGRGGMAEVFRARQRSLDREVAIKVLSASSFSGGDSRARFEREAQVTARLHHPNVVGLYGGGEDRGRPFLVLELIRGQSLREMIVKGVGVGAARAVELAAQVGAGLAAAHALGIVHRDLKPENVLISHDGGAKVADFGLARYTEGPATGLTKAGIIVGTPGYLAPEVIRGEAAGPPADLFALGVLLFELVTGTMPVDSQNAGEILVRYVKEELPRASERTQVAPALDRLIARLMSRDPAKRPGSATEVVEELTQLRATLPEDDAGGPPVALRGASATRALSRQSSVTRAVSREDTVRPGVSRPVSSRNLVKAQSKVTPSIAAGGVAAAPARAWAVRGLIVLGLLALVGAGAWLWQSALPVKVTSGPQVFAGSARARVVWTTDRPALTRFLVWPEQGQEENAVVAGSEQTPTVAHAVVLNNVRAGGRYRGRVQLPGAARTAPVPIELLPATDLPAESVRPVFEPDGRVTVRFKTLAPLTPGLQLGAGSYVWADHAGPGEFSLTLPASGDGTLSLRFRELEDTKAAPETWILATLARPEEVVSSFLARCDPWPRPVIQKLRSAILMRFAEVRAKDWPARIVPGPELVAMLGDEQKQRLSAEEQREISAWFQSNFHVDLPMLLSAVPIALRAPLFAPRRLELYEALARLDELDAACEMMTGKPAFGFAAAAAPYLRTEALKPGEAPLGNAVVPPAVPEAAAYIQRSGLPVFNHFNFEMISTMGAELGVFTTVTPAARALAIPDPGDPEIAQGYYARVGRIPPGLDFARPVTVCLQVTNTAPDCVLWLRFGENKRVLLRPSLAHTARSVTFSADPDRAEIAKASILLRAHLPAEFLTEADRGLTARLEAFLVKWPASPPPPTSAWILGVGLANP